LKLVLIGDGESPHLLKWARALLPHVELWAVSSRGFLPEFDVLLPASRRLALRTSPRFEGGNLRLLLSVPRVARWLRPLKADWLHAHYITSHGTLAWLAKGLGVRGRLCTSAWGSDILVTPQRSALAQRLTRRVLSASLLSTSDSEAMAERMREMGAREVMVFPFGLEVLPPPPEAKDDALFFANRGLEPIYAPHRVIEVFDAIAEDWPEARLVVANDGSLRESLIQQVADLGLRQRVQFVGRLDAAAQAQWYARARWYLSLPASDSVSVSVLEAMAHRCVPILSDLPANRELVTHGRNGWIWSDDQRPTAQRLRALLPEADTMGMANREWIARHAIFGDAVERFIARLYAFDAPVA
jgi:L-malate glycosyltransferase